MGSIGLLANPASGKDVRRIVARASVFDNQEKRAIIRRVLVGASAAGAYEFVYHKDAHGIVQQALDEFDGPLSCRAVDATQLGNALDTISAARAMRDAGCSIVITLGGDGTNRAFCLGWRDAPLLPISTGTNNVFPLLQEATVAGAAAGLFAIGKSEPTLKQQKIIDVEIEGERDDLALIDAVLSRERFIGARALLKPDHLQAALLTRADPAAVGITAIGGLLNPVSQNDGHGLWLTFNQSAGDKAVHAPIAPGLYEPVPVTRHDQFAIDQSVNLEGPGTLAFDGERERSLAAHQSATLTLRQDGPRVLNVQQTMQQAAACGHFIH